MCRGRGRGRLLAFVLAMHGSGDLGLKGPGTFRWLLKLLVPLGNYFARDPFHVRPVDPALMKGSSSGEVVIGRREDRRWRWSSDWILVWMAV